MIARPSLSLSLDRDPESPRPLARRHWRCIWTAAGPTTLEAEGVIQRQGDGFPLDRSRVAYVRYLRRERQRSTRATADAEHAAAKAALLRIKIEEKQRTLVRRDAHEAMIDAMAGTMLTHLSSWPPRIAGRDLALRRKAENLLREMRTEISKACSKIADAAGEPPLDEQD